MKLDHPARAGGAALVLAGLLGALVGCGGGKQPDPAAAPSIPAPAPSAPAEPADPSRPCTLLSGDAAGRILATGGVTNEPMPDQHPPNGVVVHLCLFKVPGDVIGGLSSFTTDGSTSPGQVIGNLRRGLPATERVLGVGELAIYSVDAPRGTGQFYAVKRWRDRTLVVSFVGGSREITREQFADLVKQAIDAA